jgi:2-dehydropantoate 2-reductase
MKVAVYGAGAVGGLLAARLARAGHEVSVIARGATLEALRARGVRVVDGEGTWSALVAASDDPRALGPQEAVVLAVKAHALEEVAARIGPLLGADTAVVPALNGVPWWFFDGFGGELAGTRLRSVDPRGAIAAAIPARRVVGCVVHLACASTEPGVVRHAAANRLILGEPAGGDSPRTRTLATALREAAFEVEASPRIQIDVWYKLWGNLTMNPVSALTGATCDRIIDDPLVRRLCLDAMAEAARIGARIGCAIAESGEDRLGLTRRMGEFKTSMLQDVEAGRRVELDALVAAVREIGALVGEPTPWIDALLGLARLQARVREARAGIR